MPMRRISMNKVREIVRLFEQSHLSQRSIARALSISRPIVNDYLRKIRSSGLDYAATEKLDDDALLELIEGSGKVQSERYQTIHRKFEYLIALGIIAQGAF